MSENNRVNKLYLILMVTLFVITTGCLDVEWKLQLNKDGSGTFIQKIIAPTMFIKSKEFKNMNVIISPPSTVSIIPGQNNTGIITRSTKFKNLSELVLNDSIQYNLTKTKPGKLWGLFSPKFNMSIVFVTNKSQETPKEVGQLIQGHFIKFIVSIPYDISSTENFKMGELVVKPELTESNKTVVWKIPIDLLLGLTSNTGSCSFNFSGKVKIPEDNQNTIKSKIVERHTKKFKYSPPVDSKGQLSMVGDYANIIPKDRHDFLCYLTVQLLDKTKIQMYVVTVPSLEGQSIEKVTGNFFEEWNIGKNNFNKGVLVLMAPKERKVRIEVGKGLEKILNENECKFIINEYMTPHFKKGDYGKGLEFGVTVIEALLTQEDYKNK